MMEYLDDFINFLVSLFAIANPFFTVPVFISLTRDQTPEVCRRIPLRTSVGVFLTLTIAYIIVWPSCRSLSLSWPVRERSV